MLRVNTFDPSQIFRMLKSDYVKNENPVLKCNTASMPKFGQFTFKQEGSSDPKSPYFTGKIHHPTSGSGITWGKGYDMKLRKEKEITADFLAIGLDPQHAKVISGAAGLSGKLADSFLAKNKDVLPTLTTDQEVKLFERIYPSYEKEARRLATKEDVTKKYGSTDWDKLDPAIREMVVDMTYQGAYDPTTRAKIQDAIVSNDKAALATLLESDDTWKGKPKYYVQRMKDRAEYLRNN